MKVCFKCGSAENLQDAISEKEIVKICRRCQARENLPIIKKPKIDAFDNDRPLSVQERLAKMSGVPSNPRAQREKMLAERKRQEEEAEERKKQNEELRKIANKAFEKQLGDSNAETDTSGNSSMVRNFHWIILRARRAKHLTRRDLADRIGEPEAAIEMAEKGVLPRERETMVKKLQQALNIQITKIPYGTYTKLPENHARSEELSEEQENPDLNEKERRWTIGDLLRIKKRVKGKASEESVSQEEIERIIEENSKEE